MLPTSMSFDVLWVLPYIPFKRHGSWPWPRAKPRRSARRHSPSWYLMTHPGMQGGDKIGTASGSVLMVTVWVSISRKIWVYHSFSIQTMGIYLLCLWGSVPGRSSLGTYHDRYISHGGLDTFLVAGFRQSQHVFQPAGLHSSVKKDEYSTRDTCVFQANPIGFFSTSLSRTIVIEYQSSCTHATDPSVLNVYR